MRLFLLIEGSTYLTSSINFGLKQTYPTPHIRYLTQDIETFFAGKRNAILPFGICMEPHIDNLHVDTNVICGNKIPDTPPCLIKTAEFCFNLLACKKSSTDTPVFQTQYQGTKEEYNSYK